MIELEKTYLLKEIPAGLKNCFYKEIVDIYVLKNSSHPNLRIRKIGEKYEITKKIIIDSNLSHRKEYSVSLTKEEFEELAKVDGKKLRKYRYYYSFGDRTCEIDLYLDSLKGLVLCDFEFENMDEMNEFQMPSFCLCEVGSKGLLAGGILAGKTLNDLKEVLDEYNYSLLEFE